MTVVEHHVVIGNNVRVHSLVFIPGFCILEDGCWIGPKATFTNASYPLSLHAKERLRGVIVEGGAVIGANATLLPGVRIGRRALVGAGAVVTRDVPSESVLVGSPARVIKGLRDLRYPNRDEEVYS
jgi:acetyltransferase-like isoleucine patch superfamily enzyme